ncbi:MAG TPA: hypothetical protein VF928_09300 [Usitatibacteraceae bacterium]
MYSVIPVGYRWLAIIALAIVSIFAGYVWGVKAESNRRDATELRETKLYVKKAQKVDAAQQGVVKKAEARKAAGARKVEALQQEVKQHAEKIPDPVDCSIDARRLRVINEAFGAVSAGDPGESPGRMPERVALDLGAPSDAGRMGAGKRAKDNGLRGPPEGADRGGAEAAENIEP